MTGINELYEGREQTAAKHLILSKYLEKLAYKVGFSERDLTLNYIDGFAGPWESNAADLSDTSPSLALGTLLRVKEGLAKHGKTIHVRGFFVSPKRHGVEQLHALKKRFASAEIEIVESKFEGALDRARDFARTGSNPFTFVFIDATGWTGFGMQDITPLLRSGRNEVLINFMTGHVTRFIDSPDPRYKRSFDDLFGDPLCRQQWEGLQGYEREEKIVESYCRRIAEVGGYQRCVSSRILNPQADRTHFHLVYGTRHDEGLVTFRDAERDVISFQREQRSLAQQRDRVARSRQVELFFGPSIESHTYEDELRDRYLARMVVVLQAVMNSHLEVSWDALVVAALQISMISVRDVKDWLDGARQKGEIEVVGLAQRQRVPELKKGHRVRWLHK